MLALAGCLCARPAPVARRRLGALSVRLASSGRTVVRSMARGPLIDRGFLINSTDKTMRASAVEAVTAGMLIDKGFLINSTDETLEEMHTLWDRSVEDDPFCDYRKRCFGVFDLQLAGSSFTLNRREPEPFHTPQADATASVNSTSSVNSLVVQGEIPASRSFAPAPDDVLDNRFMRRRFWESISAVQVLEQEKGQQFKGATIGVHMIRVEASSESVTAPNPEGRHQDGFDYISVSCLQRCNVKGGSSVIAETIDSPPLIERQLEPGEGIIFDDRAYFHDATGIAAAEQGHRAFRDVLVLTVTLGEQAP